MNILKSITVVLLTIVLGATSLQAHSGRTDKNGCHNETATGTRHCH